MLVGGRKAELHLEGLERSVDLGVVHDGEGLAGLLDGLEPEDAGGRLLRFGRKPLDTVRAWGLG